MKILDKIERWIAEDMLVSLAIAVNFGVLLVDYFSQGRYWIVLVALITLLFVCRRSNEQAD